MPKITQPGSDILDNEVVPVSQHTIYSPWGKESKAAECIADLGI